MKRFDPVWKVGSHVWPCSPGQVLDVHEVGGQTEFVIEQILSETHCLTSKPPRRRKNNVHIWNVVEVTFTTTYLGMKGVRAKWWCRSDGMKFLSVDQLHMAELERAERERIQKFCAARAIHSFAAYIAARSEMRGK